MHFTARSGKIPLSLHSLKPDIMISPLLLAIIFVSVGLVLLIWSADRVVFGASSFAQNSGLSTRLVGLTIVAMGTSAPEMLVSATAAVHDKVNIAVGNAIGSNIVNILLVIGLTALIKPIAVASLTLKRECPLLLLATLLGYYVLSDHTLTRAEGFVLLLAFVALIAMLIHYGKQAADDDPLINELVSAVREPVSNLQAIFWLIAGLILLFASSQILIHGAVSIAKMAGVSELVIGLTIIAIGTSLPELAASIIGIIKGEDDLALGNIIGSNIFNILAVLGIGAIIAPGAVDSDAGGQISLVMLAATVIMLLMSYRLGRQQRINRIEGSILLTAFAGYLYLLLG